RQAVAGTERHRRIVTSLNPRRTLMAAAATVAVGSTIVACGQSTPKAAHAAVAASPVGSHTANSHPTPITTFDVKTAPGPTTHAHSPSHKPKASPHTSKATPSATPTAT